MGLGKEFARTRNVNVAPSSKGSTTQGIDRIGPSRRSQPIANGSSVYGITAHAGSKRTGGGSSTFGGGTPGSGKANSMFGSRPKQGSSPKAGKTSRRNGSTGKG